MKSLIMFAAGVIAGVYITHGNKSLQLVRRTKDGEIVDEWVFPVKVRR